VNLCKGIKQKTKSAKGELLVHELRVKKKLLQKKSTQRLCSFVQIPLASFEIYALVLKQNMVDTGIIQSKQRDKFRRNRATNHTVTTRIQTSILHKM